VIATVGGIVATVDNTVATIVAIVATIEGIVATIVAVVATIVAIIATIEGIVATIVAILATIEGIVATIVAIVATVVAVVAPKPLYSAVVRFEGGRLVLFGFVRQLFGLVWVGRAGLRFGDQLDSSYNELHMSGFFALFLLAAVPTAQGLPSFTPLTDMQPGVTYKGQDGGLYGKGSNLPPRHHYMVSLRASAQIAPRNPQGQPTVDGKIGFASIGMSNTTQEFSHFINYAYQQQAVSPHVVIVDGAQGGQDAYDWAYTSHPWNVLQQRVQAAGISRFQVQAVWIKHARRDPRSIGEFPVHAEALASDIGRILRQLKQGYPNVQVAYLSSRTYGGYATSNLNPEPYAYESAFAVRSLILRQIAGDPSLAYADGTVPVLRWGPYLWADGPNGRQIDDLVWLRPDFANDGTHPTPQGRQKVAELLLKFLQNEPSTRWFNP
jgi:hypothetical protein